MWWCLYLQVKHLLETFLKDVVEVAEEFTKSAPYSHEKATSVEAAAFIDQAKQVRVLSAQYSQPYGHLYGHSYLKSNPAPSIHKPCPVPY